MELRLVVIKELLPNEIILTEIRWQETPSSIAIFSG